MPKPSKQSTKLPKANISLSAMTKVEGKMNPKDSGIAGIIQSAAFFVLCTGIAVALVVYAWR